MSGISVRNSPTPSAPVARRCGQVDQQPGIQQQLDRDAVARHRRQVAQGLVIARAAACARSIAAATDCWMSSLGRISTCAVVAIDDRRCRRARCGRVASCDPADHRNVEGARDDRDMRGRRAFLEHQPHDPPVRVIQQLGRPHRARDQDEFVRQVGASAPGAVPAGEMLLQPVGEILEIEQPLAQIGVGRPASCGVRVSSRTFCTAASAVRPLRTASVMRSSQPRSAANMR